MIRTSLILLLFFSYQSFAQPSDVILLKKNNKTIARYYPGINIAITTNSGAYIDGNITKIKNDSIFLQQFIIRQVPTQLGIYVLDTLGSYRYNYNYRQIVAIGKTSKGFSWSGSAASLIGGGTLLTLAGGVVYLADREKFSPALMIASVSLAGLGYLMAKTGGKGMMIGKKYSLVYLSISDNKK